MKILVINSNTNVKLTAEITKVAQKIVRPSTQVEAINPDWGVSAIEGSLDAVLAAKGTLEKIIESEAEYDAFVIACYSDPGLQAAREITSKPVLGIAETSMLTACFLGNKFSILTPLTRIKPVLENLVRFYGLESRCASIRAIEANVSKTFAEMDKLLPSYIEEGKKALGEGAEVLCLGGAIFAGMDRLLSDKLKVPVIDGLSTSVKLAETFYELGFQTSKALCYRYPEKKDTLNCSDLITNFLKP